MKGQITLQEWMKPDVIPHCEHFVKYTGQQENSGQLRFA